jgi:hypothetical protein
MYKFSVYEFTDKEINQIVELAEQWLAGSLWTPIDKRRYTKQVIQYATNWRLLVKGSDISDYNKERESTYKKFVDNRVYNNSDILNDFVPAYDAPVEVLWRLFEKHVLNQAKGENNIYGYSLSTVKGWLNLNIRPNEHKDQQQYDLEALEQVLIKLASYNYITWQRAGNTWWIEIHEQNAYPETK